VEEIGMVAEIEGVRVDSEQFPDTYRARNRIFKIAIRFRQPVQDMLQESMMKEMELKRHPTTKQLKNLKENPQYYENYLAVQAFTRQLSNQKQYTHRYTSLEDVKDQVEGTFVTFSRKEIYTKMFIDEVFQILKGRDKLLHGILKHKAEDPEGSWRSIYARHYQKRMSRGWFFHHVAAIRTVARKMAGSSANVLADMNLGIQRDNRYETAGAFAA
jgi:hypothetical protein